MALSWNGGGVDADNPIVDNAEDDQGPTCKTRGSQAS